MYNIEWAKEFNGWKAEEYLNLQEFAKFFKEVVADRYFEFLTSNPNFPSFIVETEVNQLPHLLGLHKWCNLPTKNATQQFQLLHSGELTLEYLKAADEHSYKDCSARIEFIPYLYNLFYAADCSIKLVHPDVHSVFRNRNMSLIFQKSGSKLVHIVELRRKKHSDVHVPASISIYKKGHRDLNGKHLLLRIDQITIIETRNKEKVLEKV